MIIQDNIGLKMLGEDECVLDGQVTQNNIPVIKENYVHRMNANNGFTGKRMFRKIASIPIVAHLKATQAGYNLDDRKDLYRFLADNPDYMCVDRIDTGRDPRIIVK